MNSITLKTFNRLATVTDEVSIYTGIELGLSDNKELHVCYSTDWLPVVSYRNIMPYGPAIPAIDLNIDEDMKSANDGHFAILSDAIRHIRKLFLRKVSIGGMLFNYNEEQATIIFTGIDHAEFGKVDIELKYREFGGDEPLPPVDLLDMLLQATRVVSVDLESAKNTSTNEMHLTITVRKSTLNVETLLQVNHCPKTLEQGDLSKITVINNNNNNYQVEAVRSLLSTPIVPNTPCMFQQQPVPYRPQTQFPTANIFSNTHLESSPRPEGTHSATERRFPETLVSGDEYMANAERLKAEFEANNPIEQHMYVDPAAQYGNKENESAARSQLARQFHEETWKANHGYSRDAQLTDEETSRMNVYVLSKLANE